MRSKTIRESCSIPLHLARNSHGRVVNSKPVFGATFVKFLNFLVAFFLISGMRGQNSFHDKVIFVTGGSFNKVFVRYLASLTGKEIPKICYVPTASADNPAAMVNWYQTCEDLPIKPYVLRTFINSSPVQQTFDDFLMGMDAIVVGGGNTLNMIAIWKAQGIDTVLKKAYEKGIILAGGSAGSLCWFDGGYSDSRPKKLSIVSGLGLLPYSHCPHFHSEPERKPLYYQAVISGKLGSGYACDDMAAILFINGKMKKSVALDAESHCYFISQINGQIKEEKIESEIIR